MTHPISLYLLAVILMALAGAPAHADLFEITFLAVDENDEPLPDVEIANRWILNQSPEKPFQSAFNEGKTDKDGKCTIEFDDKYQTEHVVLCYSADRKRSGIVTIESQDVGSVVKIKLVPVITVKAKYFCPFTKAAPKWTNTIVSIEGKQGYFFEFRSTDGEIEYPLPPGKWSLRMYGQGIITKKEELITKLDEPVHDLGRIEFEVDAMTKLKGKPAPELQLVDKRGTGKDFKLSDLKGKWVLIEFWGYW